MITELQTNLEHIHSELMDKLIPTNLRTGVQLLGVTGNLEPDKPDQNKTCTPSTNQQVIQADTGYELAQVTVAAVDNTIDSNIQAENIKQGVTILGITGTYEGSGGTMKSYTDVDAMNADINNITEGEVVKILGTNPVYYIKDTTMKKLIKEEEAYNMVTMDVLNYVTHTSDEYEGLGGTEQEVETVLDDILGTELATMCLLNGVTGTQDSCDGLGGTEEEVIEVFDSILGNGGNE